MKAHVKRKLRLKGTYGEPDDIKCMAAIETRCSYRNDVKCRGRNRIILFFSSCCTINCNWILDTSNRTFNKAHTKWLLLDFYLLAIPMSGFQLLIECCWISHKRKEKLRVAYRARLAKALR